jgi:hypothetical protein
MLTPTAALPIRSTSTGADQIITDSAEQHVRAAILLAAMRGRHPATPP